MMPYACDEHKVFWIGRKSACNDGHTMFLIGRKSLHLNGRRGLVSCLFGELSKQSEVCRKMVGETDLLGRGRGLFCGLDGHRRGSQVHRECLPSADELFRDLLLLDLKEHKAGSCSACFVADDSDGAGSRALSSTTSKCMMECWNKRKVMVLKIVEEGFLWTKKFNN